MSKLTSPYVKVWFKQYLEANGYKENTISSKMRYVEIFLDFLKTICAEPDLRDVNRETLLCFLEYLEKKKTIRKRKLLSKRTKRMIFLCIKQIFHALYEQGLQISNPAQRIKYKPQGIENKRKIMDKEEIAWFLDQITERQELGLRDRAMFELLYATGIRSGELVNLNVENVNFEERMLFVRRGKWEKDRIIPINDVALKFLTAYLKTRKAKKSDPLFLGSRGNKGHMYTTSVNSRFKKLLKRYGMYKKGLSVHSIRHSVSVHLLANGADIRYVQEFLGHESIETTVNYTHELHENIKKIYRAHHPRENAYVKKVDAEYLAKLEKFHASVIAENKRNPRRRKQKMISVKV